MVLGFRLYVRCRLVAVWWMANKRSFCFISAFHNFATLKNQLTYQCTSSWPVVITMKKKLAGTWKKSIGYWPVQINGNKFATSWILKKTGRSCEGADFSWLSSKVSWTLRGTTHGPHHFHCISFQERRPCKHGAFIKGSEKIHYHLLPHYGKSPIKGINK
jgi:hypothetical protein